MTLDAGTFDLDAYCRRIGLERPRAAGLATLEALALGHVGAIPFENLDVLLGRPILLDLASLQAKLVQGGRGGYCFEHNTLMAGALRILGFAVATLEARVRRGATTLLPRTHGILRVEAEGRSWLMDVGFGGDGLLGPVPMDGTEIRRHGERHRLAPEGRLQVLQAWVEDGWTDLYAFAPDEVYPVDWAMANHYTSTHPDSRFTRILTAQLSAPGHRQILRGRTLTVQREGGLQTRELRTDELLSTLREQFGLRVPEGLERVLDATPA
jgi:N-hydroxyarylamine O-acetyltransferase